MSEPNTFESTLRQFDAQLRLRWGGITKCWIVERECSIEKDLRMTLQRRGKRARGLLANASIPKKRRDILEKEAEEGISAVKGRRIIIWTNNLDNRVFDALWMNDLQRHGVDILDYALDRKQKAAEKKRHEEYSETAREVDEVVWWAREKKSAEVEGGKAIGVISDAFKRPYFKNQPYSLPPKPLLDAYSRPVR
jgi:hypothetical protein